MALDHREFLRTLRPLLHGRDWRRTAEGVSIVMPPGRIEIVLGKTVERSLGSLLMPETEVTLTFPGLERPQIAAFMTAFDKTFHRGGG